MKQNSASLFNRLSVALLALTVMLVLCYGTVLINPYVPYNPFPPPPRLPTATPTMTPRPTLPPTWTPTATFTPAASPTPRPTSTPTRTPAPSPTWPPTPTPTPRVTRSPYPFTCEVTYQRPQYDNWTGVAGHFQDLDGNPLPGYYAQVECPGAGTFTPRAGDNNRYNIMYGSEAAWEQACNPVSYQAMEVRVRMYNDHPDSDGTYRPVSEQLIIPLGDYAGAALGYVTCTLNWENWR